MIFSFAFFMIFLRRVFKKIEIIYLHWKTMKLIVVLLLSTQSFIIAMNPSFPLSAKGHDTPLVLKIKKNKELYMTFNNSNPIIQQLSDVLKDFKDIQQRDNTIADPATYGQNQPLQQQIKALEETKILLIACMREIKDLNDKAQDSEKNSLEKIMLWNTSALEYKIKTEEAEQKLIGLENTIAATKQQNAALQQKNTELETEKTRFIKADKKTILYRNIFATSFVVSAISFLGYYLYSKK